MNYYIYKKLRWDIDWKTNQNVQSQSHCKFLLNEICH